MNTKKAQKKIGYHVKAIMKMRGYNVSTLSAATGTSRSTIYKVFNGHNYEIAVLMGILDALDTNIELYLK